MFKKIILTYIIFFSYEIISQEKEVISEIPKPNQAEKRVQKNAAFSNNKIYLTVGYSF